VRILIWNYITSSMSLVQILTSSLRAARRDRTSRAGHGGVHPVRIQRTTSTTSTAQTDNENPYRIGARKFVLRRVNPLIYAVDIGKVLVHTDQVAVGHLAVASP
jgi:hypothetical protein